MGGSHGRIASGGIPADVPGGPHPFIAPLGHPHAAAMPACISIDHGHLRNLEVDPRYIAVAGPGGRQFPQWSVRYWGQAPRRDEAAIRRLIAEHRPDAADAPLEFVRVRLISRFLTMAEALTVLAVRPQGHVDPGVDRAFEEIPDDRLPRIDLGTGLPVATGEAPTPDAQGI